MLLRMFCCLELVVWSLEFGACCLLQVGTYLGSLGSWVLVYMNLGRVLLGLAVLHVVGEVEEEDTQDRA